MSVAEMIGTHLSIIVMRVSETNFTELTPCSFTNRARRADISLRATQRLEFARGDCGDALLLTPL